MQPVRAGRVIHWTEPAAGPHLWFVLSDVDPDTSQVVMVRLVTARVYTDKTVVLQSTDHPFIQHESNIDFGGALLLRADKVNAMLKSGEAKLAHDMTAQLLATVRDGLISSSHTIHFIGDYCRTRW